jgi:hypothetical protein
VVGFIKRDLQYWCYLDNNVIVKFVLYFMELYQVHCIVFCKVISVSYRSLTWEVDDVADLQ